MLVHTVLTGARLELEPAERPLEGRRQQLEQLEPTRHHARRLPAAAFSCAVAARTWR